MKKTTAIRGMLVSLLLVGVLVSCAATRSGQATYAMANADPFSLGTATVHMNQFLATDIKIKELEVKLDPRSGNVFLDFSFQGVKNVWNFDRATRDALVAAYKQYENGYSAKTLDTKGDLTAYGHVPSFIRWGLVRLNAQAQAKLRVGYEFIDKAPYFSIILPVTDNDLYTVSGGKTPRTSSYIGLYCTRAQAKSFMEKLEQSYIEAKFAEQNIPAELLPAGQKDLNTPDTY